MLTPFNASAVTKCVCPLLNNAELLYTVHGGPSRDYSNLFNFNYGLDQTSESAQISCLPRAFWMFPEGKGSSISGCSKLGETFPRLSEISSGLVESCATTVIFHNIPGDRSGAFSSPRISLFAKIQVISTWKPVTINTLNANVHESPGF